MNSQNQNNMTQSAEASNPNISFTNPPHVQIIEASCKQADSVGDGNGSWTNVLKEPILIRKGSEIKALSTFVDAPGIDSNIIQFTRSGGETDNSHTLLTQMYVSNDGFNNKTCSYDYMGDCGIDFLVAGQNAAFNSTTQYINLRNIDNSSNIRIIPSLVQGVPIINRDITNMDTIDNGWEILDAGTGYSNGDVITVAPNNTVLTDIKGIAYKAKLIVGSLGEVLDFVLMDQGYHIPPASGNPLQTTHTILSKTGGINFKGILRTTLYPEGPEGPLYSYRGSGVIHTGTNGGTTDTVVPSLKQIGITSTTVGGAKVTRGGTNINIGDIYDLYIGTFPIPGGVEEQKQPGVRVQIKTAKIDLTHPCYTTALTDIKNVPGYFDQGYNYQKCPLYRWCQTYDSTSNNCYGRNYLPSYTATDGIEYNISQPNSINELDPCLSAQFIIGNKEDEFVPGFFHKNYAVSTSPGNFNFYKPSYTFKKTPTGTHNIELARDVDPNSPHASRSYIEFEYDETGVFDFGRNNVENKINVFQSVGSTLSAGMVINIEFDLESTDANIRNDNNMDILQNSLIYNYSGLYCIGTNDLVDIDVRSNPAEGRRRLYLGAPVIYDSSGESDGYGYTYKNCNIGRATDIEVAFSDGTRVMDTGPHQGIVIAVELVYSPSNPGDLPRDGYEGQGVVVNIDANGLLVGSPYNQGFGSEYEGWGWRVGDIWASRDPTDPLIPTGYSTFKAGNTTRFVVAKTDNINGMNFSTFTALKQDNLFITDWQSATTTHAVTMNITPVPFYMEGMQPNGILNPSFFGLQEGGTAPSYFSEYTPTGTNPSYPPILDNAFVPINGTATDNRPLEMSCGLYKPSGKITGNVEESSLNKNIQIHDPTQSFTVLNNNSFVPVQNPEEGWYRDVEFTMNGDATSSMIYFPGATPALWRGSDQFITFNQDACLGNDVFPNGLEDFPLQGLLVVNQGRSDEEHIIMGGKVTTTRGANTLRYVKCECKARKMINMNFTGLTSELTLGGAEFTMNGDTKRNAADQAMWAPDRSNVTIRLSYWVRGLKNENKLIQGSLNEDSTGTMAVTSKQNFFNTNDLNLLDPTKLKTIPEWKTLLNGGINANIFNSYNQGGFYYLSNAKASMTSSLRPIPKFFGFSQGYGEFLLTEQNTDVAVNIPPAVYNNYKSRLSTITAPYHITSNNSNIVYGYEPVYQQKSFAINRNFAVPSDISNFWNKQSHELEGLIDRDTGIELTKVENTGLVQNPFMHPVYGSNNDISVKGEYIKNFTVYPNSGGLLGGHCVGIGFPELNQNWLDHGLVRGLPKFYGRIDELTQMNIADSDIKCYYIFFRNAFTFIRNYDPVAKLDVTMDQLDAGGSVGLFGHVPDRTAINTLQTKALTIGNCSTLSGYTGVDDPTKPTPLPTGPFNEVVKKLVDGTTMSFRDASNQYQFNATKAVNSAILSELMDVIPNQKDTDQESGSKSQFPGFSGAYPVRYLDNDSVGTYDRAIAAQYCGSANLTLAFSNEISSFTFQFFYSPYTSPFVDDSGGDNSIRVFYGNRKVGLYNHDCYGGISVCNWARPNFPRGIMTNTMVKENTKTLEYPNGVNPFVGVASIGRLFLNKLGFSDDDLSILNKNTIDIKSPKIGFNVAKFVQPVEYGGGTFFNVISFNSAFGGTNAPDLDTSDAVLTAIQAPENFAGLFAHNILFRPTTSDGRTIRQLNGDYIFYPYSISNQTNSFNSEQTVRFDNCTDAFGTIGGLGVSQMGRGLGLPTTTGSTTIVDKTSIPVALNCDCNLYLSFTVEASSNSITASLLPKKMNHGHLILLSSLCEEPNFIMSKVGAVNGLAIISKAYITADFILSNSFLSFYAQEDRIISEITSKIVNTNFEVPTILGDNSTVLYQITNYSPKPLDRPITITEIQNNDYNIMNLLNQHLEDTSNGKVSAIGQLQNQLNSLGMNVIEDKSDNIIRTIQNQINAYGLQNLPSAQRRDFFNSPEGKLLLQNSADLFNLNKSIKNMETTHNTILNGYADQSILNQFNQQRRDLVAEIRAAGQRANQRQGAGVYVKPEPVIPAEEPVDEEAVESTADRAERAAGARPRSKMSAGRRLFMQQQAFKYKQQADEDYETEEGSTMLESIIDRKGAFVGEQTPFRTGDKSSLPAEKGMIESRKQEIIKEEKEGTGQDVSVSYRANREPAFVASKKEESGGSEREDPREISDPERR